MKDDDRIILDNFEGDGESVSVSLKALTTPVEDVRGTKRETIIIPGRVRRIFYQKLMGRVRERSDAF